MYGRVVTQFSRCFKILLVISFEDFSSRSKRYLMEIIYITSSCQLYHSVRRIKLLMLILYPSSISSILQQTQEKHVISQRSILQKFKVFSLKNHTTNMKDNPQVSQWFSPLTQLTAYDSFARTTRTGEKEKLYIGGLLSTLLLTSPVVYSCTGTLTLSLSFTLYLPRVSLLSLLL